MVIKEVVWIEFPLLYSLLTSRVIMIDNSWWLFWAHFKRACLIQPLDSATNTTMGKSKELSIDLKKAHFWFDSVREVTWSHFKSVTGPEINCKQLFITIDCMAKLSHCQDSGRKHKLSPAAERGLVRVVKSQKTPKSKPAMNYKLLEDRRQYQQSAEKLPARKEPLLQIQHLKSRLLLKSFLLITWTRKKPSVGKLCCQMEQKINCLVIMSSSLFWMREGKAFNPENTIPTVKHGAGSIIYIFVFDFHIID